MKHQNQECAEMDIAEVKKDPTLYAGLGMKVDSQHTKCPAHGGSDSVSVKTSDDGTIVWRCHNCKQGGTIIDAYSHYYQIEPEEAIKRLAGSPDKMEAPIYNMEFPGSIGKVKSIAIDDKGDVRLKFSDADYVDVATCKFGDKHMAQCVIRWNATADQKKVIRQFSYDGSSWNFGSMKTKMLPIYKMMEIENNSDAIVFMVEGEKCMHALSDAMVEASTTWDIDSCVVTSWIGGSEAIVKANVSVLRNRRIIFIRDNDAPGLAAAMHIKSMFRSNVRIVNLKGDVGYDVADWLGDGGDVRRLFHMEEDADDQVEPIEEEEEFKVDLDSAVGQIEELRGPSSIEEFLGMCVTGGLGSLEMEIVIQEIKRQHGFSIGALKSIVSQKKKVEWADVVANAVIKERSGIIYCSKIFWTYTGKYWAQVQDETIKNIIDNKAGKLIKDDSISRAKIMDDAFKLFKARVSTEEDYLNLNGDPNPVINVQNGELWIQADGSVILEPHRMESKLTYCLNTDYDPKATCPEYEKNVIKMFRNDADLFRHFEEVAGYLIQPVRNHKNFFMFYGPVGNNGKTSIAHLIMSLMGSKSTIKIKIDSFGQQSHDNAMIVGKLLAVDDDMNKGTKLPDGRIKELSERKEMTANQKFKDAYNFVSNVAVLICTNHFPNTTDLSQALRLRAQIIPFLQTYSDNPVGNELPIDKELFNRIRDNEKAGVLNKFLAGLRRLRVRGKWELPTAVEDMAKAWLLTTNNMVAFFVSTISDTSLRSDTITAREIRSRYIDWCRDDAGIQDSHQVQTRTIKQALEDMGYRTETGDNNSGGWKMVGYRFKE
jgi:putative DNA primase/helicase